MAALGLSTISVSDNDCCELLTTVNNPLPKGGNGAGAVAHGAEGVNQSAGALGRGSVATSAVINMNSFVSALFPLYGAILADTKWGRWKSICVGVAFGVFSHCLLVVPAIPAVIQHNGASLGVFIISLLILAWAGAYIKPCLSVMICDQSPVTVPVIEVLASGERVVVDPTTTVERYMMVFYWCINIGAFFALATTYASRFVGFWLAFLLPGIVYLLVPIVLVSIHKKVYKAPPQGTIMVELIRVFKLVLKDGGWKRMFRGGPDFWNPAKPSFIEARDGTIDLEQVFWDDLFVDEVQQTMQACAVFFILPFYYLADGGLGNSTNSMSNAMVLDGVPNDLITNFNALTIIVGAPFLDYCFYPMMTRLGRPLKPMTRMCIGFLIASAGCLIAALVQWRVYATSPCGYQASTCKEVSKISLWWQIPFIALPAFGELFVNVTSYEMAYTRSPARMKNLVSAMTLVNGVISSGIQLAVSNAIQDPYLIWPCEYQSLI